jgi:ParB family chromosome partitioning protein
VTASLSAQTEIRFDPAFPVELLQPASYNPRRITPDAFAALRESISRYGMCKPVILNADGTLVAGHQRTRALKANGVATTPAILLSRKVRLHDEIRFNLFHNSVETGRGTAHIPAGLSVGYSTVEHGDVTGKSSNMIVREIVKLIVQYGPWGSVVADPDGRIILNADYALAAKLARVPVLAYTLPAGDVQGFLDALARDYGVYDYTALGVKPYNQLLCQMNRLRRDEARGAKSRDQKSTLYEGYILPAIKPGERLVDFGAGHGDYVARLLAAGHRAFAYEPHLQPAGARGISVRAVVRQLLNIAADVQAHGLYQHVVLDSVLNSLTSLQFEEWVLASCNALTAADGTFYAATRNRAFTQMHSNSTYMRAAGARRIEFLDPDAFSASFRSGVWTLQHFHTVEGLRELLDRYFHDVSLSLAASASTIQAVCRRPRSLPESTLREALDAELNMEYPGGYRHDRHGELRDLLLRLNAERGTGG